MYWYLNITLELELELELEVRLRYQLPADALIILIWTKRKDTRNTPCKSSFAIE